MENNELVAKQYAEMASSDAQQSRAKIATKAMTALMWVTGAFVVAIMYVYGDKGADDAFSGEMAAVFLTITGTFTYVVRAYFNDLKSETKSRHQTIDSKPQPMSAIAAAVSSRANK